MMGKTYSKPFLLSDKGSTRGSAYTFSNKSITLDGKTHVVWLDAVAEVMGRSYNHADGTWSETFHIGMGQDNHTTPAITADQEGHIRIAYGPHARGWNDGRFKYARSLRPNDISEWEIPGSTIANFGYSGTYACLTHMPQGQDMIVYRGGDYPFSTMFQHTRPEGGWSPACALFSQAIEPQYTHYGSITAMSADGTLYVGSHFYNVGKNQNPVSGDRSCMRSYGAAIIKSADLGQTWTTVAGEPVTVPALYSETNAIPPLHANVRIMGLALDDSQRPVALVGSPRLDIPELLLVQWDGSAWQTTDLAGTLPEGWVSTGGGMTVDIKGRVHAALMAVDQQACGDSEPDRAWGHPSTEIFHLIRAGEEVTCSQISPTDPDTASWLPNISRQQLFAPVECPTILYTHGIKGEGCSPPDENRVYCILTNNK
jgi:hypothetical protein